MKKKYITCMKNTFKPKYLCITIKKNITESILRNQFHLKSILQTLTQIHTKLIVLCFGFYLIFCVKVQCGEAELEKKIDEKIEQFVCWVEKHPNKKSQVSDVMKMVLVGFLSLVFVLL